MFIGHYGVGFAAKKAAPGVSLGLLFVAAQFIDLLWPVLLLLGFEHVAISPGITKLTPLDFTEYPISHSLVMVVLWGLLLGGVCRAVTKNTRYAIVLGLCVVSHWFLDLLVHRPDLPVSPGESVRLGLGLWNYPVAAFLVEGAFFIGGIFLYTRATTAKNAKGTIGLWVLVGFLLVSYATAMMSPPPPTITAIGWGSQAQWLFVLLAFWVDRKRVPK